VDRIPQILLIASTIFASWLGMQDVHELGHVIGAWFTGGRVARVVLHPLGLSRTEMRSNPLPLVVAWAGPVLGTLMPLALWGIARRRRWSVAFLPRFFAGFCLIANGSYLGVGSMAGCRRRPGPARSWCSALAALDLRPTARASRPLDLERGRTAFRARKGRRCPSRGCRCQYGRLWLVAAGRALDAVIASFDHREEITAVRGGKIA
jgi:hypothetical protein